MKRAQIASLPEREKSLIKTVESLYNQVDVLFIALNNYQKVPSFLKRPKIECVISDNSLGDSAKFYDIDNYNGYFFSCDDDLIYPEDYIKTMINAIDTHKCLVTFHGKVFNKRPIRSYYHGSTDNYRCLGDVTHDVYVDVSGSGVSGFHTDHLKLKLSEFKIANMADIWLSKQCHNQNVKQLCLKHDSGYFQHTTFDDNIYAKSHRNETDQTAVVNTFLK